MAHGHPQIRGGSPSIFLFPFFSSFFLFLIV